MTDERNNVNREYKDRLFKLIFREKEDLLQLYNAINGTNYNNPEDLEINTLEDAVYMGMKNDISFLVKGVLSLYEHQSTYSPNLPLRGLFYFADLYRKMMSGGDKDLYSSKQIKLPFPQFVVFYNGTRLQPERQVFHLHSAFPKGMNREIAAIDCHAVVLNINYGQNREIMRKCRKLEEYSKFIGKVRENTSNKMSIKDAVDHAVEECINEGILEKILRENREEVCSMLLSEYDEQAHIESEKKIAREEGRQEGIQEGIREGIIKGKEAGLQAGEDLLARLVACLQHDGRFQDMERLSDAETRKRLYQEYNLSDL